MPSADRRRVKTMRRAWRLRSARRDVTETAYAIYVVAVMGLFVIAPGVAVVIEALRTPAVLDTLRSPEAPTMATLMVGLVWATAVWIGAGYGPVTMDPPLVRLWAGTDLPRRVGLRRPFAQRTAALVAAGVATAAFVGGVLLADDGDLRTFALGLLLGALVGAGIALAWLVGQAAPRRAWWLGLVVAVLALLAAAWAPGRWLAAVGLAAVLAVPRLLDAVRGPELLAQSVRWHDAATTARYGDVQYALGSLRALPRRGRRWRALVPGPALVRLGVADLVGTWRTTGRFVTGAVSLTAASAVLAVGPALPLAPLLGAAAALLAYLALGVFCDGLREAAAVGARPGLFGHGPWRLFALHAVAPAVVTLGAAGLAGLALVLAGREPGGVPLALVLVAVLVVRAWGAAKGQIPVDLLAPVPTPMGDLSGLVVVSWLADAPLVAGLVGGGTAWLLAAGRTTDAVVAVVVVVALLVSSLRKRVDRL